jgi:hypothetical protein
MEDRFHGSGLCHYHITTLSSAFARLSSTSHVYLEVHWISPASFVKFVSGIRAKVVPKRW